MKDTETRQAKASPAVSASPHKMKRAGSRTCLCGVECFTLAWTAGLLAAFLSDLRVLILLLAAGLCVMLRLTRKERLWLLLGAVLGAAVWLRYDAAVRQPMFALDGKKVVCTGRITNTRMLPHDRAVYTLRTGLNGIADFILDLDKLDYISSAGLRVLLSAQKVMNKQGSMVILNANEDLMEIFEVTGFTDILTIR